MLELLLKFFFTDIFPVLVHNYALRRETDPVFRKASDEAYGAVKSATTSAERKAASRKLYELQKSS